MKVVILAGGLGTRLAEETTSRPKPMIEIGGRPMLWHIMKIFAHYGHRDFVLCLGYKAEMVKQYFLAYPDLTSDFTLCLRDGQIVAHHRRAEDWRVTLVDTGQETQTGGRLRKIKNYVDSGPFLMTYGDGVSDLCLDDLVSFHRRHGRLATLTAARPPGRFGNLEMDGDRVTRFAEKPPGGEGWINAGFFVLEPGVFSYLKGDDTVFEREPLENLARDGELMAYRHHGFWQCMDTLRDVQTLNRLWASGKPPWKMWE